MRSRTAALCLALALTTSLTAAAIVVPQPAQAQARYSHAMFYDDLAPYGRWVDHPRYGWVWYPTQVRSEWRPYSEGSWEWTDRHGWYWNSYEPFGWATYHYGRWGYDDRYGHIWVPGDEWAPAWVSFRHGNDAIGWAPLPPETLGMTLLALLSGGRSSSYYRYVDLSEPYYRSRWVFVPTRYFNDPRGYSRAYSWRDNDRYWRSTTNVTNYVTVNNYYVNRSIDPRRLESRLGRKIETVRVQETSNRRELQARRDERSVRVFNPRIERDQRQAPPQAARAKPDERPVVTVRPEFAAPEERRAGRDGRGQDGRGQDGRGQNERDDRNRAERDNRPAVTPATPSPSERAVPPQRDRAQDRTGQDRTGPNRAMPNRDEDRRGGQQATTPNRAVPDRAAPERTPPQRTMPASPAPRVVSPPARQENQQRATPVQRPQPSAPAQRTVQPERNERAPTVQRGQPTKQVAPPVQRAQPTERAAPPQRARPQQATRPDNSNRRQEQPRQQQQQRRGNPDEERGGGRR